MNFIDGKYHKHKLTKKNVFFGLGIIFRNYNLKDKNFLINIFGPVFTYLHNRGILILYWVLNTEKDFNQAVKSKVHGIMTDYPQLLSDYLKKRDLLININK